MEVEDPPRLATTYRNLCLRYVNRLHNLTRHSFFEPASGFFLLRFRGVFSVSFSFLLALPKNALRNFNTFAREVFSQSFGW